MPLDHYIPQVHLRRFYSPVLGDRLHAVRKSDLKSFTPAARGVCAVNDGSTNAFLVENRAIEEFLKEIEPNYCGSLDKLYRGDVDAQCIFTLAGFVAYVATCSPGAMRIQSGPMKANIEATAAVLDAQGLIPPSPPALGGKSLAALLRENAVQVSVDPKYPQAVGIDSIRKMTALLGNFEWEILRNESNGSPFFTSDYPIALEATEDKWVLNKVVPLAPDLAVRIKPDVRIDTERANLSFSNFRSSSRTIGHHELVKINTLLVRCAEETVFYRDERPWVRPFIARNRFFHVEAVTSRLPTDGGVLLISTQRVVPTAPNG